VGTSKEFGATSSTIFDDPRLWSQTASYDAASFAYLTLATGKGPLAEIDFWRERNAALSSLFEQLNLPNVRKMIEVLETAPNVVRRYSLTL
jgi:hypothetical protein